MAAALSCLALAACGSSGRGHAVRVAQAIKFSDCMRSHGLTNFPDPTSGGGGIRIQITPGSGLSPSSPTFRSAQAACQKLLPGGGPGNGPPSAQVEAQALATSKCMRSHGVSDFPDPTTTAPAPSGNYGAVMGHNGVYLALPSSIDPNAPAFKRAASACHFGGP